MKEDFVDLVCNKQLVCEFVEACLCHECSLICSTHGKLHLFSCYRLTKDDHIEIKEGPHSSRRARLEEVQQTEKLIFHLVIEVPVIHLHLFVEMS
jgi:hypothetical protein